MFEGGAELLEFGFGDDQGRHEDEHVAQRAEDRAVVAGAEADAGAQAEAGIEGGAGGAVAD